MASPSAASRTTYSLASRMAYRVRGISRFCKLGSGFRNNQTSSSAATPIADSACGRRSPPPPSVEAGANPRHFYSGVRETFSPRRFTSSRGLDFSSRLHSWGAPPSRNAPLFMTGLLSGGVGHQVRKIFVEVKGNDLDRALRKWRRKCKEENLKALKDREYFKKPSEKRVLALKERDRRIARRSFKRKLNWILNRRQRGF